MTVTHWGWTYTPGPGLLFGTGDRWLLLADHPANEVVTAVWDALRTHGLDRALAVLERAYDGPLPAVAAWSDARATTRGDGTVSVGPDSELGVGHDVGVGPWLPVQGGVVPAAGARVRRIETAESAPTPSGRPARAMIDGIPEDIASSRGPEIPRRYAERMRLQSGAETRPTPAELQQQPDPSEQEQRDTAAARRTTRRGAVPADDARPDHLRQPTRETVLAVWCLRGHPTPAYSAQCRVCRGSVPAQEPQRIPRPRLGGLRLPSGEVVALDRAVVIGRRPAAVDDAGEWPHLVTVPPEAGFVSRVHVQIELDGWLVVARDVGSRGGTTLRVPGRDPESIRAQEPHVLEPGQALDLAEEYQIVYEVTPETVSLQPSPQPGAQPGAQPDAQPGAQMTGRERSTEMMRP